MFTNLSEVMVYVNDLEAVRNYWVEKFEFVIVSEGEEWGQSFVEFKPSKDAQTSIMIYKKSEVLAMSPEMNVDVTPSLMFATDNLKELCSKLRDNGVTVGEVVELKKGKVTNFCDCENNYFAVMELNK